jgi:hypothetical protein
MAQLLRMKKLASRKRTLAKTEEDRDKFENECKEL